VLRRLVPVEGVLRIDKYGLGVDMQTTTMKKAETARSNDESKKPRWNEA